MKKLFAGIFLCLALSPALPSLAADAQASVTGVICNAIKDGTEPFDKDNSPGNDSGDNNRVLRTFDEAAYTLEYTMNMKPGASVSSLSNVTVGFEFSIPGEEGQYRWAKENMGWISSSVDSYEDGKVTIRGTTKLSQVNGADPVPGSAAMIVRLQAASIGNGSKVEPTFKLWVEGDDANAASFKADSSHTTADGQPCSLTVSSSAGNLDIQSAICNVSQWGYVNPSTGYIGLKPEKGSPTHMVNSGWLIALKGDDAVKGVKGMEVPKGDISFDVTVSGTLNGKAVEPLLWDSTTNIYADWIANGKDDQDVDLVPGHTYGRETYWYDGSWDSRGICPAPWGGRKSTAVNTCYDVGDFTMVKIGAGKYRVTVKDYVINGHFPRYNRSVSSGVYNYDLDINIFTMGGYQFYIPLGSDVNGTASSIRMEISNLQAVSASGKAMADRDPDNNAATGYCTINSSSQRGFAWLYNYQTYQGAGRYTGYTHDALVAERGENVYCYMYTSRYQNGSSDTTYAYNYLFKFDDQTAEPLEDYGVVTGEGTDTSKAWVTGWNAYQCRGMQKGGEFRMWGVCDPGKVKVLYGVKADGSGWKDLADARAASASDLKFYSTLAEAKSHGTCVAVMLEGREAEISMRRWAGGVVYLRVKDNAAIGRVGFVVPSYESWGDEAGKKMTAANSYEVGCSPVAEPHYRYVNGEYQLTEYMPKEDGWWYKVTDDGALDINPYAGRGISYLVTGETVTASIANEDGKSWYNLNQGERTGDFYVNASLRSLSGTVTSTDVTVKVTLGDHLSYIKGSGTVGGTYAPASGTASSTVRGGEAMEPAIGKNSLGQVTLTWTLKGCDPKEALPRIHYKLEIGNELDPVSDVTEFDNPLSQIVQSRSTNGAESGGSSSYSVKVNLAAWGTPYCVSQRDVRVNKALCTSLQMRALQGTIERNEDAQWRSVFSNTSAVDSRPWNIYQALPYEGDGRGSAYSGTPVLRSVTLDGQYGKSSLASGLKLYVTTDAGVRDGQFDAKAYDNMGISWVEVQPKVSGTSYTWDINRSDITGIKLSGGSLKSFDALNFTVSLEPTEGSRGGDLYAGSVSAYADRFANTLFVAPMGIQVVKRTVSGVVFNDRNKNGYLDLGSKADCMEPGITVCILDKDGNPAKDVFGKAIPDVVTGADGAWSFTELPSGRFYPAVKQSGRDGKYELIKNGPDYGADGSGALKEMLDKDNDAVLVSSDFRIQALKSWDGEAYTDTPIEFAVSADMNPAVQETSGCRFGLGVYWSDLTIEKVVDKSDSIEALGQDVFFFKAEGTGWDGQPHTYYFCVDVKSSGSQVAPHADAVPVEAAGGASALDIPGFTSVLEGRQTLRLPSGNYRVSELSKGSWEFLDFIAVNGTVDGDACDMDLLIHDTGLVHARDYRVKVDGYQDQSVKVNDLK